MRTIAARLPVTSCLLFYYGNFQDLSQVSLTRLRDAPTKGRISTIWIFPVIVGDLRIVVGLGSLFIRVLITRTPEELSLAASRKNWRYIRFLRFHLDSPEIRLMNIGRRSRGEKATNGFEQTKTFRDKRSHTGHTRSSASCPTCPCLFPPSTTTTKYSRSDLLQ